MVTEKILTKQQWIDTFTNLAVDKRIVSFIGQILFQQSSHIDESTNTIRNLFSNGYCYYFAKILEDAFPGGELCICYPVNHIVYVYEGVAYDINGISNALCECCIPVKEFGRGVDDFRHIPDQEYNMPDNEEATIYLRCKENDLFVHAKFYDPKIKKLVSI